MSAPSSHTAQYGRTRIYEFKVPKDDERKIFSSKFSNALNNDFGTRRKNTPEFAQDGAQNGIARSIEDNAGGKKYTRRPRSMDVPWAITDVSSNEILLCNLLRSGSDPNGAVDDFGVTPMHVAAGCDVPYGASILEEMMRAGGNANLSDCDGMTPVHVACTGNRLDCLRVLMEHGGDPNVRSRENYSALDYARRYGAVECIKFLTGSVSRSRPALSTLNGERMTRHDSRSSVNSTETQYHSACSSPFSQVPQERSQRPRSSSRTPSSAYPSADFDSDAGISPYAVRKTVLKRTTSGNRDVPRRSSQTRLCEFSSDSEDEQEFPASRSVPASRSNSRTRATSAARSSERVPRRASEEGFIATPLSQPSSRVNSYTDLNVESTRGRRLSGKENESAKKLSENEIQRLEYAKFASVTDQEIRQQLKELGGDPGPILTSAHRAAYINRLILLKRNRVHNGTSASLTVPRQNSFCAELKQVINMAYNKDHLEILQRDFNAVFYGIPKRSFYFTYLLIDPQISQNLPHQAAESAEANLQICFKTFLHSIFYVGKGKDARPMKHLVHAKRVYMKLSPKTSPKIERICSIWKNGHGVVCIRLFDHRGEEEAFSRESLMIEALGTERLTNVRNGTLHVAISKWSGTRRRLLGSSFLQDAFHCLLAAGETQIFEEDIRP